MRRWAALMVAATVAVAAVGYLADDGPALRTPGRGNPALVQAAEPLLDGSRDAVAIALVTPETTRYALFGTDTDDQYEIASVTKPMTGALLADAVERGDVDYDTPVGELLEPLEGSELGEATLEQLATYHAGLSLWGPDTSSPGRWITEKLFAGNPRAISEREMYARALADPLDTIGEFNYSNLSFALLGAALEAATETSYDELLQERLLDPLGMRRTTVAREGDRNQTRGFTESGRRSMPWNLDAFAPAGGVRSSIGDMAIWARSLLSDEGIGNQSMDVFVADGVNGSGLGWYTRSQDGRELVWKTGQTGGFTSFAAVDRTNAVAVVVLSNTAQPFDDELLALLEPLQ